jgi:pre-mRNA-processing factor SLU7
MTHKTKDCLERPRSKGAKYTNKNIAADEKVEDLSIGDFEAKRDRWNGYDSKEYERIIERYEQLEEMRKEMRKKEEVRPSAGSRTRLCPAFRSRTVDETACSHPACGNRLRGWC